jgi:hypothetical protein
MQLKYSQQDNQINAKFSVLSSSMVGRSTRDLAVCNDGAHDLLYSFNNVCMLTHVSREAVKDKVKNMAQTL